LVFPREPTHLKQVATLLEDGTREIPVTAQLYVDQSDLLTAEIKDLTLGLSGATKENVEMRRLCAVPGVGPVTAGAVMAFAPDLRTFSSGRTLPHGGSASGRGSDPRVVNSAMVR
jgi:transposase